jgi:hypothetical protein
MYNDNKKPADGARKGDAGPLKKLKAKSLFTTGHGKEAILGLHAQSSTKVAPTEKVKSLRARGGK